MKYPRASGALRLAPDPMLKRAHFARTTLLHTIGNLGLSRSGPPLIKSWIRPCLFFTFQVQTMSPVVFRKNHNKLTQKLTESYTVDTSLLRQMYTALYTDNLTLPLFYKVLQKMDQITWRHNNNKMCKKLTVMLSRRWAWRSLMELKEATSSLDHLCS